jgi:hypothetical protein
MGTRQSVGLADCCYVLSSSVNIRLDGLPFESNHFDFVRVVGIGLGVPEDEVSVY